MLSEWEISIADIDNQRPKSIEPKTKGPLRLVPRIDDLLLKEACLLDTKMYFLLEPLLKAMVGWLNFLIL